jgi:hypothetical protein
MEEVVARFTQPSLSMTNGSGDVDSGKRSSVQNYGLFKVLQEWEI